MDKKDILKQNLEYKVKQLYGSIIWNHKIHENESSVNTFIWKIFKIMHYIFSTITTIGLIYFCLSHSTKLLYTITFTSTISLVILLFTGNSSFENKVKSHDYTANEFLKLREDIELLICKIKSSSISNTMIEKELKNIIDRFHKIRENALRTGSTARKLTLEELEKTNEIEVSEENITDLLLEQ